MEVVIAIQADNIIEGTEFLTLQLQLTDQTQQSDINNAGNIFFQDTSIITVIDTTGNYNLNISIDIILITVPWCLLYMQETTSIMLLLIIWHLVFLTSYTASTDYDILCMYLKKERVCTLKGNHFN